MKCLAYTVSMSLLSVVNAYAFCHEPTAPSSPGTYSRPSVPYCMSGFATSGRHSCKSYEVEAYKSEVEAYIEKLQSFASEAERYRADVVAYAQCEMEDVLRQHK